MDTLSSSPPKAVPIGFGRYQLHRLLAEGGMAEVFLAEQQGLEGFSKTVALKRMLPHLLREGRFISMFLDEARTASRLSHPNVVQIFDFGEAQGQYFLAMEFLAGEDCGAILKRAKSSGLYVPTQITLQIIMAAADGLHYAHEFSDHGTALNLIHRDISPSNIMVTYQGGVKVIDFGIARALDRQQEQTASGVVKGKFPYCSPEQVLSKGVDRRTDIFALAIVLHEMLAGRRLFKRDSEAGTCMAVIQEAAPLLEPERPGLPKGIDAVLQRALAKHPEDRFSTMLELRRALERFVTPPVERIDEYMRALFGEERIKERSETTGSSSRLPTGVVHPSHTPRSDPLHPLTEAPDSTKSVVQATLDPDFKPRPGPRRVLVGKGALTFGALAVIATGVTLGALRRGTAAVETPPSEKRESPPPPPAAMATLDIETTPLGAKVSACGRPAAIAPAHLEGLPAGPCTVRAELEGFDAVERTVELKPSGAAQLMLGLTERKARLKVDAPEGAHVMVDGIDKGPPGSFELEPGSHRVKVVLAGFQSAEQTVSVDRGETVKVAPKLTATKSVKKVAPVAAVGSGLLDVSCVPWCRVFVDGVDVGKPSPIVGLKLSAGPHQLRLEHPPSGSTKEVTVDIKADQTVREQGAFGRK